MGAVSNFSLDSITSAHSLSRPIRGTVNMPGISQRQCLRNLSPRLSLSVFAGRVEKVYLLVVLSSGAGLYSGFLCFISGRRRGCLFLGGIVCSTARHVSVPLSQSAFLRSVVSVQRGLSH